MKIIANKSSLRGEITVPGSKSHTIRGLVFGLLAKGQSCLLNPLLSEDTESCYKAAINLGATIKVSESEQAWYIDSNGLPLNPLVYDHDLGNSGTSLRLLTGVVSLMEKTFRFDGDHSLRTRLMEPLLKALQNLGATYQAEGPGGKCPFTIKGPLRGGQTEVDGTTSQFLSSLLVVTPFCPEDTEISVKKLNEKPYVHITLNWLKELGIAVDANEALSTFKIRGRQVLKPFTKRIPADFSTACFPLCAAAVTNSPLTLRGLDFTDVQGDKVVFEFLKQMGMQYENVEGGLVLKPGCLQGATLDLNATPDALPILSVLGCFAKGKTVLANVPQARFKETDRIAAMTTELRKLGARIEELPDGMIIHESPLTGGEVHGHHDHRIVMSLAIAGLGAMSPVTVDTAESAAVTYPKFAQDFKDLGADFHLMA